MIPALSVSYLPSASMLVALMQTSEPFVTEGTGAAWRGLLAIGGVLGLISLLSWLIRRGHLSIGNRAGRSAVSIESAVALGERRSLVIVSVEGRRLMLGLTPTQVSLVTELAPAPKNFGSALAVAENEPRSDFQSGDEQTRPGFQEPRT